MGGLCTRETRPYSKEGLTTGPQEPVILNIYDIGQSSKVTALNRFLRPLGTGAFHCGVEVYRVEWSYSDTSNGEGDGIFCSQPRCCEGHTYCESVLMGGTATSETDVLKLLRILQKSWTVKDYDTLRQNCCHFSNDLCRRLGVGSIPKWVMNLAGAGAALADTMENCRLNCCCTVQSGTASKVELVESRPVVSKGARAYQV